ncbi:MAG: hypothetical protein QNK40_10840 [Desulfobacterales bacterium]|nr:hypothetical protein [Desulfobacterales bacterium]
MTLLFLIFIISTVLAHAVVEVDALTDAGVVNIAVLAAADVDPDVLNEADKLGLGSLLPGPSFPLDNTRQSILGEYSKTIFTKCC